MESFNSPTLKIRPPGPPKVGSNQTPLHNNVGELANYLARLEVDTAKQKEREEKIEKEKVKKEKETSHIKKVSTNYDEGKGADVSGKAEFFRQLFTYSNRDILWEKNISLLFYILNNSLLNNYIRKQTINSFSFNNKKLEKKEISSLKLTVLGGAGYRTMSNFLNYSYIKNSETGRVDTYSPATTDYDINMTLNNNDPEYVNEFRLLMKNVLIIYLNIVYKTLVYKVKSRSYLDTIINDEQYDKELKFTKIPKEELIQPPDKNEKVLYNHPSEFIQLSCIKNSTYTNYRINMAIKYWDNDNQVFHEESDHIIELMVFHSPLKDIPGSIQAEENYNSNNSQILNYTRTIQDDTYNIKIHNIIDELYKEILSDESSNFQIVKMLSEITNPSFYSKYNYDLISIQVPKLKNFYKLTKKGILDRCSIRFTKCRQDFSRIFTIILLLKYFYNIYYKIDKNIQMFYDFQGNIDEIYSDLKELTYPPNWENMSEEEKKNFVEQKIKDKDFYDTGLVQCITSIDDDDPYLFELSRAKRECLKDELCLNKIYPPVPWLKECSLKSTAISPSCIPSKFTNQIFHNIKLKSPAEQSEFIKLLFASIKTQNRDKKDDEKVNENVKWGYDNGREVLYFKDIVNEKTNETTGIKTTIKYRNKNYTYNLMNGINNVQLNNLIPLNLSLEEDVYYIKDKQFYTILKIELDNYTILQKDVNVNMNGTNDDRTKIVKKRFLIPLIHFNHLHSDKKLGTGSFKTAYLARNANYSKNKANEIANVNGSYTASTSVILDSRDPLITVQREYHFTQLWASLDVCPKITSIPKQTKHGTFLYSMEKVIALDKYNVTQNNLNEICELFRNLVYDHNLVHGDIKPINMCYNPIVKKIQFIDISPNHCYPIEGEYLKNFCFKLMIIIFFGNVILQHPHSDTSKYWAKDITPLYISNIVGNYVTTEDIEEISKFYIDYNENNNIFIGQIRAGIIKTTLYNNIYPDPLNNCNEIISVYYNLLWYIFLYCRFDAHQQHPFPTPAIVKEVLTNFIEGQDWINKLLTIYR